MGRSSFGTGMWQDADDGSGAAVVAQFAYHYDDGSVVTEEHIAFRPDQLSNTVHALPQTKEFSLPVQLLGVESIGNNNQKITAVVQGVDLDNPTSGYERPVVAEGPHMILAPYATDDQGELHVFRTIQMRTGRAVLDTPRGFADADSLANGQQMYDVDGAEAKVTGNMQRIVGEETGDALEIKKIVFMGEPRVNGSFVTSKSAVFGVEVDYKKFIASQKVVKPEELARRQEQFDHEGLVGAVVDMTLPEYVAYKQASDVDKDMAADHGTDAVVINFLDEKRQTLEAFHNTEATVEVGLVTHEVALTLLEEHNPDAYQAYLSAQEEARQLVSFATDKREE